MNSFNQLLSLREKLIEPIEKKALNFVLRKPNDPENYDLEFENWFLNLDERVNTTSILAIYSPASEEHSAGWQCYFSFPRIKPFKGVVSEHALLGKFLEYIQNKNPNKAFKFSEELLELIVKDDAFINKDLFEQNNISIDFLKSHREHRLDILKGLTICYEQIGHTFFKKKYQLNTDKLLEEQNNLKLLLLPEVAQVKLVRNIAELSLFPLTAENDRTKLNTIVTEQDLFNSVLSYINQVDGLVLNLNPVFDVCWKKVEKVSQLEEFIKHYEKKHLFSNYQKIIFLIYVQEKDLWYFKGELAYGRLVQGYLDQRSELAGLANVLKGVPDIMPQQKKLALPFIQKIMQEVEKTHQKQLFLNPITLLEYEQAYKAKQGILIYDIGSFEQTKLLKQRILEAKTFSSIIKLSKSHYIAFLVEFLNESDGKFYVIDSKDKAINYQNKLSYFLGMVNGRHYKLEIIDCKKQKRLSENSLLHAYLNAAAAQWSLTNSEWLFLNQSFYRQRFSSAGNIERIKVWLTNPNAISASIVANALAESPINDLELKLENQFKEEFFKLFSWYVSSLESATLQDGIEEMKRRVSVSESFGNLVDLCKLNNPQL